MIKYKLECKNCETTFDSWFASSKEFEKLKKKHLLVCHICNSKSVDKTLMAPSVKNNKKDIKNNIYLLFRVNPVMYLLTTIIKIQEYESRNI